jgi:LacI family transcriptional regulator
MAVTIRDVAKQAGVAPVTVSRVINNSGVVSQKTRQSVQTAIDELGYIPNMLGPSLRSQQTMTLAFVVTDITNPFWTTVTRGVVDVAQTSGYSTILCNTDESEEKQEQYIQMLLRRRIDGILLVPASTSPDPIKLIQNQGIPVIVLDRQVSDVDVDTVRADSEEGAYQLTLHLLSQGHKQIVMLAGPRSVSTALDRVNGFRRAFNDSGLELDESQVIWGSFTQESGYQLAVKALDMSPKPSAFFAGNNFIAVGAQRALREMNYRIPEDMVMVAVDEIPPEFTIEPMLTVAKQPAREMGKEAARLLIERIKGEGSPSCKQILLPTELIIRNLNGERNKL